MEVIAYGLTKEMPSQLGKPIEDVGLILRDCGITGVFLKHLTKAWSESLQDVGLSVYASKGIFIDQDDLWSQMPDSRPVTADGSPASFEGWYRPLLPTHPGIRQLRLEQITEMVQSVPVDGLWLDFIRWPARWEKARPKLYHSSFDSLTLTKFQQESGVDLPVKSSSPTEAASWILDNATDVWFAWRCNVIASFVDEVRTLLKEHRPQAKLGCFTVPWSGLPLDELPIERANLRIVGQDPALLGPRVDVLSPMVYHRLCGHEPSWPKQVTTFLRDQAECDVWPIVEAIAGDVDYPTAEFFGVCKRAANAGSGGLIVFNLDGLLADPEKLAAFATIW